MAKPKPKTRGAQKQKLIGKQAVTRDYQPIMIHHWGVRPRDLPIFTFLSVQAMLYDPTIRLGLAMRAAPVYQTKFGWKEQDQWKEGVQAKNEAVGAFVYRQLQRIWQHDVPSLVKSQLWGHAGGEVMLKLSEDNLVEVDRLLERHPNDIRALKRGGQNVGIRVSRLTKMNQGGVDLEWPKAYWTSFGAEAGSFYGTSILIGAYSPWYDKWCDGGALDVRRLYMHKDAYVGASIYYPEGDLYTMPDGQEVPARDLARQMIEQIVAGGVVALPSDVDEKGNRKWELKPATVASNPAHILKYPQDLDTEMLRGIEVPDDIFTADSQSSGAWAGKKVPLSAFYAGIDCWIVQLIKDLTRCIFEPLVLLNFGKAEEFQICHKPLAEQAMEQQNQPQGPQQPGGPGGEPGAGGAGGGMPGGLGGPGGADDGGGGGGGGLAELLSSPAAQQARQGGGGGQQAMSLEAAIGRGVIDAAKIVQASRETVDAALRRMAGDVNPWVEYHGPRGGKGWRHSGTGDVRYGGERPGAGETGGEEQVTEAAPFTPSQQKQAPSYSRTELPQIRGSDKPEFYKQLSDEGIKVELKSVPAGQLRGIQRDLNPEKVDQMAVAIREKGSLGKSPLMASNDGYIVDGHHRWAAEKQVDPNRSVAVAQVDLPVHDLIAKIEAFPKSFKVGTDEAAGERPDAPAATAPAAPAPDSNEAHVAAYQRGDKSAAAALLKQNGGLIYNLSRKFAKKPSDMDDLQQEARIALLHAAHAFDAGRGFQFSTFATKAITNRLSDVTSKSRRRQAVWHQTPEDEEGRTIEPSVAPDDLPAEQDEQRTAVMQAVNKLPGRARAIVQRRYGLDGKPPENATEIAGRFGMSRQRVSQILQKATDSMRGGMQDWMIRLAAEVNPWVPYTGPRGGHGWRHSGTGDVRYGGERPGAHETGSGGSEQHAGGGSGGGGGGKGILGKIKSMFAGSKHAPAAQQPSDPTADWTDDQRIDDWKTNGTRGASFKSWFGDWERDATNASKVVNPKTGEPNETHEIPGTGSVTQDANGQPIVMYHGTSHGKFEEFDKSKIKQGYVENLYGSGFYFTEDRSVAEQYKTREGTDPEKFEVKACYLNIRRPFDMNRTYQLKDLPTGLQKTLQKRNPRATFSPTTTMLGKDVWRKIGDDPQDATEKLGQFGFDGITHIGIDRFGKKSHRVWIAFEPEQIKSTDNQGTFSKTSRNIRMAGDVNPWVPHRGVRGGQGWKRTDTGKVRYQKDRPGAHEGRPGQTQPAPEARPMSPEEFTGALNNLIDNPQQHGLSPEEAGQLKQAVAKKAGHGDVKTAWQSMDASEKVAVLDDLTGHKYDTGTGTGTSTGTGMGAGGAKSTPAPAPSPTSPTPQASPPQAQAATPTTDRNGIGYGVRGGWPWSKPAPSHWDIMGQYQQVDPNGDDTREQYKTPDAEGSYDKGQYTPERQQLHNQIVDRHFVGKQPVGPNEQPTYMFLGGGTAAGKSTVLRTGRVAVPHGAVHVDSDEIKNDLPEFQRHAEDRNVEAAGIVHEESSDVSKMINEKALSGRYHAIMDGTGDTSLESVAKKVNKARAAGHKIVAHYMNNDIEKAVSNAEKRAKEPPYRMVAMEPTLKIHAGVSKVFPKAVAAGLFDEVSLWDTNGEAPVLVASGKGKNLTVHDQDKYNKFLAKRDLLETHKHLLTDRPKDSEEKVDLPRPQQTRPSQHPAIAMALGDGQANGTGTQPSQDANNVSMEDVFRITREVAAGAKPKTQDTPEQARFRASVQRDYEKAKANGLILHVPTDWAD